MCDPFSIMAGASLAFGVGSKIAGAAAQNKASKVNAASALKAFRQENRDIAELQGQEKRATAVSIFDIERTARRAQSVASVSAGEAGVTGQSVRDILNDIDREKGEAIKRTEDNLEDRITNLESEKITGRERRRQRVAAVPGASTFGTIISVGGELLGFGSTYLEGQRGKAAKEDK